MLKVDLGYYTVGVEVEVGVGGELNIRNGI